MSDDPAAPLLGDPEAETGPSVERPRSTRSKKSSHSKPSKGSIHSDESTPLLSRDTDRYDGAAATPDNRPVSPNNSSLHSVPESNPGKGESSTRWPTAVALTVLSLVILTILGLGFAAPAVVEEYAKEAMVFKPTDLSIDSFTASGVNARIRGDFKLDGSRVGKKSVRDLGRTGTWIVKAIESRELIAEVYLPEYGNILLGTASIPPIIIDIRDGHVTHIDILAHLKPSDKPEDIAGLRQVANKWLEGRLDQLRVRGKANVGLRSGIFSLGTHTVSESLIFEGHGLPAIPKYNITKFNLHEMELSDAAKGMAADLSLSLANNYPLTFTVPPLGFHILVPGCPSQEPFVLLANATTDEIQVLPKKNATVNVQGIMQQLSKTLTTVCPTTHTSPLDALLGDYIHGADTTIFVRGADAPAGDTPQWISDLTKSITIAVPFPGHPFDNFIRDFSMKDVHLYLPNPFEDPDSPESQPQISAIIQAVVSLPNEMNFPINISRVRADADVYYRAKKLGVLDLHKWQQSNSTRLEATGNEPAGLKVDSVVKNAPLNITDDDVFTDVVQAMAFGRKPVVLGVKALVDVETKTILGKFIIRGIPAEGKVPIKPLSLSDGGLSKFSPKVGSLKILETTKTMLHFEALVNITNPTEYFATVPYVNIKLLSNGTHLGYAVAETIKVAPGENDNIPIHFTWNPLGSSGKAGIRQGRELLSRYISGYNTTLSLQTYEGTIPSLPQLGRALSSIEIELPTPELKFPKNPNHNDDNDENAPRFIDDATMHLFSSTATFTLLSPLPQSTIFITWINATAYYNHTEPVGNITYSFPFAVPPGVTKSPRLPVKWSLDGVGYEAVKQALGGTLKLDAKATVGVMVGQWQERVWFSGAGIGVHVQI